ncbi:MAG: multiheme c-type cytochrome [Polyangiaceae bacterium]
MRRSRGAGLVLVAAALSAAIAPACSSSSNGSAPKTLTQEQLMDPESCTQCHAQHVDEWKGSMHAYAADDPVFVAMNARAQRDTGGSIGSFCVGCHAPMAVRTGATTDGSNLASLPQKLKGVTCYFCHSADSVTGAHDAAIHLSGDGTLRADIPSPVDNAAHASAYSALHDGAKPGSAQLCGTCHDVTTTTNVDIERTYAEWQSAIYAKDDPKTLLTCESCHMPSSQAPASDQPNMPVRAVHSHAVPGVDVQLDDSVQAHTEQVLVQQNLDPAIVAKLCVTPPGNGPTVTATLDDAFVGHDFPSGATHDRRAWLELVAYAGSDVVFSSGVVDDGKDVLALNDPSLWIFRQRLLDANGVEVKFMWQAASTQSTSLTPSVTNDPASPLYYHALSHTYDVPPNADRITMRLRMIAVGYDVLDALIASGDLDPSVRARMKVLTLAGTQLEWTAAKGFGCVPQ